MSTRRTGMALEGRSVTQRDVADAMNELFGAEPEPQAAWLADASAPDRPAPTEPPSRRSSRGSVLVAVVIGVGAALLLGR